MPTLQCNFIVHLEIKIYFKEIELKLRVDFLVGDYSDCPLGRYDVNCERECHCEDVSEQCNQIDGSCQSRCHPHWTGPHCQGT